MELGSKRSSVFKMKPDGLFCLSVLSFVPGPVYSCCGSSLRSPLGRSP